MSKVLLVLMISSLFCTTAAAAESERDRFIKANAEISCFSMSGKGQFGTTGEDDDPVVKIAKKHGFSLDQLEALGGKYPNAQRAVGMQMQKECPDTMQMINRMGQSGTWKGQGGGSGSDLQHWKKQ